MFPPALCARKSTLKILKTNISENHTRNLRRNVRIISILVIHNQLIYRADRPHIHNTSTVPLFFDLCRTSIYRHVIVTTLLFIRHVHRIHITQKELTFVVCHDAYSHHTKTQLYTSSRHLPELGTDDSTSCGSFSIHYPRAARSRFRRVRTSLKASALPFW